LVKNLDLAYALQPRATHALSIEPYATERGLAIALALSAFFIGLTRFLSRDGARWLATSVAVIGFIVSLVGIIQKPFFTGKIYGFWSPIAPAESFGPFINKNHFAGWMLMALPLTLSLLFAGISEGMRGVRSQWHDRLMWFASQKASRLLLIGTTAAVMGLALVLTMSRSGMTALVLALLMCGGAIVWGAKTPLRRFVALLFMLLLAAGVVWWVGADIIAARFSETNWTDLSDRRGIWADTWTIVRAFPVVGTGFNTYTIATLFYQRHLLNFHVAQAHNDYLQLLAEGGLLLIVPAAIAALVFVRDVARRFREGDAGSTAWWLRVGAVTGLAAIALQETFEFSLQMPGNAALCVTLCAIAVHRAPVSRRHREREAT